MSLNVIIGPAQSGKKEALLKLFIENIGSNPLLVVPSTPEAHYIRRELLRLSGAIIGAEVVTYSRFIDDLAARAALTQRRINNTQQKYIVQHVTAATELTALAKSSQYPGFYEAIAGFFNELTEGMNSPEATAKAFAEWGKTRSRGADYLGDIGGLYRAYMDKLEQLDVLTEQLLRWEIVRALESGEVSEARPIFMYGFDDFTTSQRRIVELLSVDTDITFTLTYEDTAAFESRKDAVMTLLENASSVIEAHSLTSGLRPALHPSQPSSESQPPQPPNQAQTSSANNIQQPAQPPQPSQPIAPQEITYLAAAGERGEVELAGIKILELLGSGKYRPDEIVVILRDPVLYSRSLVQVFEDFDIPYSLNEPLPLRYSALGRAIHALTRFAYEGGANADLVTYLRIRYPDLQEAADDFERSIRLGKITDPQAMPAEWSRISDTRDSKVEALLSATGLSAAIPLILDIAADALQVILEQGARFKLNRGEGRGNLFTFEERASIEAFTIIKRLLTSIEQLKAIDGSFEPQLLELPPMLAQSNIRLGREAEAGKVHVFRVHRARGRLYKAAFVLGLNEGRFPKALREDPFFNREERRQLAALGLEIMTRDDSVAEERYLFYVATTRATEKLYLSYQRVDNDGDELLKSSFISDFEAALSDSGRAGATIKRPLSSIIFDGVSLPIPNTKEALRYAASEYQARPEFAREISDSVERRTDLEDAASCAPTPTPAFQGEEALDELAGKDTFSVSELESFLRCPFKWFVEKKLKPQDFETELDARIKGSIYHTTLERFYRALPEKFGESMPVKEKLPEMEMFIVELLEDVFTAESPDTTSVNARFTKHEMSENLKRLIRAEAARPSPFTPRYFEAKFGMPDEIGNPGSREERLSLGEGVYMRGVIDRIDTDDRGRAAVIDYKSNKISGANDLAKGKSLQLQVYAMAASELFGLTPAMCAFVSIAKTRIDGMYNSDILERAPLPKNAARNSEDFEAILGNARETLIGLADELKKGEFKPNKDADCRFCPLPHICRKGRA
ncbi:MAG: exodeoxyribonuclease V subunit gamma [Candidatus Aquicultor sp.]|nr:exodeoxyribonuclease V subunit gamma [Candidatus Aquicultor sp.]